MAHAVKLEHESVLGSFFFSLFPILADLKAMQLQTLDPILLRKIINFDGHIMF